VDLCETDLVSLFVLSNLVEVVFVQLAYETGKVAVLKVLR
jgi:hypothetical protein